MSASDLRSITITDFRSISGQITIPLDAPIVLLHGVNGAGKSSVLSAIELALTGRAAGLAGPDGTEPRHLVHRGRAQAEVVLNHVLNGEEGTARVAIAASDGSITGRPALNDEDRKTFVERCYLAQSTVSRLLEIYQHAGSGESALTRFVKDLLGLDKLEALIDGLFPAGDIRRLRHLVPSLPAAEAVQKRIHQSRGDANQLTATLGREVEETRTQLAGAWTQLLGADEGPRLQRLTLTQLLELDAPPEPNAESLERLEAMRQELAGLKVRAASIPEAERAEIGGLEERSLAASAALAAWQASTGAALNELLVRLRSLFPDLPSASSGAALALSAAEDRLAREMELLRSLAEQDEAAGRDIAEAREQLSKVEERLERLVDALSGRPDQLLDLTGALTELLPHVEGSICPVCQRDFAEVSETPLADHLASHVASMTSEAKRLQELADSIRGARADRVRLSAQVEEANQSRLTPERRLETRRIVADLTDIEQGLAALAPQIGAGEALAQADRSAREELLEHRNATSRTAEVRQAATQAAERLGLRISDAESLEPLVANLLATIESRVAEAKRQVAGRSAVLDLNRRLEELWESLQASSNQLDAITLELNGCESAIRGFEERRNMARSLASEAERARARVVREVFNHSLNHIWRDLFVRLVPSEPYVPAFHVVTNANGRVSAELETQHRDGGTGGNPSYMLSAGNLNTGAVTLFVALHLSVNPNLPWLLLDDPVQSMDEVHIAQFAALLRTLAKRQGTKLIVAVHERSLFDYLALELSPAFQGDKLVTVELSRPDGGLTEINPEFKTWKEDRALAAV